MLIYISIYISYTCIHTFPQKILHSAYRPTRCNFRLHCQQTAFQKCHKPTLESVQGRSEFSQQFACLTPQSKTNPGIKKVYSLKLTWAMKIGLKCPKRNRIVLEAVFFKGYAATLVLGRVSHHRSAIRWKFLWPFEVAMISLYKLILSLDQARVACTFNLKNTTNQKKKSEGG